jgi:hypothetical protein
MIKTHNEKIETVKSRKIELKTDYLLETLNKMDVMSLMNNIWYRIDENGNRIVLSPTEVARVPMFRNNPGIILGNNYEPILKQPLSQSTTMAEMELAQLTHITGDPVAGVKSSFVARSQLANDKDWYGMGWCINSLGNFVFDLSII